MTATDTVLSITMTPADLGLMPIFIGSSQNIAGARKHIEKAMRELGWLDVTLRAYGSMDSDEPTTASVVIDELELALEGLS